jgi:hypothetical protein
MEIADFERPSHHVFSRVFFGFVEWELSHLNPFAFRAAIEDGLVVDVVVFFSCHCFTHSVDRDERDQIPLRELYSDGRERRVLNPQRYELSKRLPGLIRTLGERRIRVEADRDNYFLLEETREDGSVAHYAVFFEVEKDERRKKRIVLRVQSAYPVLELTRRQQKAGKINFHVLLRAVYQGRRVRR